MKSGGGGTRVLLQGHLYEITALERFVRSYLADPARPDEESVRPLKGARVALRWSNSAVSGAELPSDSVTDESGRFEVAASSLPEALAFIVASRLYGDTEPASGTEPLAGPCYRSASFPTSSCDGPASTIYVAYHDAPNESGFSQNELAALLEQTREHISDIETLTGFITSGGISLNGTGKGATASVRVGLTPDGSSDLDTIVSHTIEDLRLSLPGPAWLTRLAVPTTSIEASIRAGVRDLAAQINDRLKDRCLRRFAHMAGMDDDRLLAGLAHRTSLSLQRIYHPVVSRQEGGEPAAIRGIAGNACLGFPRVAYGRGGT